MIKQVVLSRGVWICLILLVIDITVVFIPIIALLALVMALIPRWGVVVSAFYIRHYNSIHGTHFEILDISHTDHKLDVTRIPPK